MLNKIASFALSAILVLVQVIPADAWFRHGSAGGSPPPPVSCPQATDNGCAAANQNGSFININLLTSAQQSGQNSLLPTHPMTFNIPGVDYPIGPDGTLTPQDPRTISTTNCAWIHTGGNTPPNDYVGCFGSGVIAATLNNYDFCGSKIGKAPISLYAGGSPSAGSTLTVTNSYFCINATTSVKPFGWNANNWSIVYKNNQCDGTNAVLPGQWFCLNDDQDSAGTTVTARYNAFTNQNVGRILGGAQYASLDIRYNFIQGLNDLNTGNHGELSLRAACRLGGTCAAAEDYEGNFTIWNRNPTHAQNNANFFPSTGASDALNLTSVKIINNIVVANLAADSVPTLGNGLFGQRAATLGDVTITGNWLDASGAGDCGVSGAASGGNNVGAQQTGTVLSVTSLSGSFNNFPIEPGWQAFHSAYSTSSITSNGTGTGNTGTYNMGGGSQSAGPDSNWTLVPGFTSQTLSGNMLLNDPSHTGSPTAIGYSGPQMTAANCF